MNCVFFLTLLAAGFGLVVNETGVVPPRLEQYEHMTAQFGAQTRDSTYQTSAPFVVVQPEDGCKDIENEDELYGSIVLVKRGGCDYIVKAINVANFGGVGMVVGNDQKDKTLIWMSKTANYEDVYIPCVFVTESTYNAVLSPITNDPAGTVIATISTVGDVPSPNLWTFPSLMQIITYLLIVFPGVWALLAIKHFCRRSRRRAERQRRIRNRDIPEVLFTFDLLDPDSDADEVQIRRRQTRLTNGSCPICLENFEEQIKIKLLPCEHGFHSECIGPWFADHSDSCPICRQTVPDRLEANEPQPWCCCRWRVPSDEELSQPLLVSDIEENEFDIEAPVVVNQEEVEEPVRAGVMSLQRVEEPVQVDSVPEAYAIANENQPNSIEEYRQPVDQPADQMDVKIRESNHDEGGRRNTDR